jgi:hypothetical protein
VADFTSWQAFYASELQSVVAVIVAPAVFLLWLARARPLPGPGAEPAAAAFIGRYALVFGLLTIVDPLCTGPLVRGLGLEGGAATAVMLFFVLLGDFRVFFLLFALRDGPSPLPAAAGRAARWTLAVPAFAWPTWRVLAVLAPELPDQTLWLLYELSFAALALLLRHGLVSDVRLQARPALRGFLRAALAYVAVYYALWALSDVLILAGGLDAGWALRTIPNQLYYAFWVPFVYFAFFSARYEDTSASAHAVR